MEQKANKQERKWDESVHLLKLDGDKAGAVVERTVPESPIFSVSVVSLSPSNPRDMSVQYGMDLSSPRKNPPAPSTPKKTNPNR